MVQRQPATPSNRCGCGYGRGSWFHSPSGRTVRGCYQTDLFPGRNIDESLENDDSTTYRIKSHSR